MTTREPRTGPAEHRPVKRIRHRMTEERCVVDGEFWPCRAAQSPPAEAVEALLRELVEQDETWAPPRPNGGREDILRRARTFLGGEPEKALAASPEPAPDVDR